MFFVKAIFTIGMLVALSACSSTAQIQYLEPAEVSEAATLKRIAVNDFVHDSVGLASQIETKMHETVLHGRPYFTLLSRTNLPQLIEEQKLQYSGLTPEEQSVQLGKLMGVQAFINGEVTTKRYYDRWYLEKRSECMDKKCKERQVYHVRCRERAFVLSASLKMVAVESAKIIYSGDLTRSGEWQSCADTEQSLPMPANVWRTYADSMAEEFVGKIAPKYVSKKITLLEEPDIVYTALQQDRLTQAIAFVEANRLDKADALLRQLVLDTQFKSVTANYNLGVVKEALGEYEEAKRLYRLADAAQTTPLEAINEALLRIDSVMAKHQRALKQIEQ